MNVVGIELVKNGEINISPVEWEKLNDSFSRDEIIQLLSSVIEESNLPLPYRPITREEAAGDFQQLVKLDTGTLWKNGETFTKYPYKYPLTKIYIDASTVGNKASDYFHQVSRFRCDSINAPSPYRTWTIEKFRKNVLKALWTLKFKEVNNNNLRQMLALRNYVASQFRPSAAKAIYTLLKSRHVLDFSSGWGDRLAGFYAAEATETYHGYDPNENLFNGYLEQTVLYSSLLDKDKFSDITIMPAEEADFGGKEIYDTVFTSPPYFNAERYTQENNQSWKRYRKLDSWLHNFLFPILDKAWYSLQIDGHLVVNIADVYTGHRVNQICDPMNDFISTLAGAEYVGGLGYRMMKRPNSASDKKGIYVEPIWTWKKGRV